MCILGFSPRKSALTLYFCSGLERHAERLNTVVAFALSSALPRAAYLRYKKWLDRAAGGLMTMLGVKLAASAAHV